MRSVPRRTMRILQGVESAGDEVSQGVEEPLAGGVRFEKTATEVVAHGAVAADDAGDGPVQAVADLTAFQP